MEKIKYAVIGSGRQGVACAYDLAKNGNAYSVLLLDIDINLAKNGADRINKLLDTNVAYDSINVKNHNSLVNILSDIDVFISAVPYHLNPQVTKAAIEAKASMVDLGGHTDNVRQQLKFNEQAKNKKITIVPDCGMGPGMNISMALLAMEQLEKPEEVRVWDGGLPQNPVPPWNYNLFFHINGLTNEYYGNAYFIRDYIITEVECFKDLETVKFNDNGLELEACVTSGGLSTMPWTFEKKIKLLENKTLRYPGHWEWMKAYRELGLFEEDSIDFKGTNIIPREFYHYLLEPKIDDGIVKDVCLMRVECIGIMNDKKMKSVVECIEYYDEKTEFTAMEKWTGWHASIVAIEIAHKRVEYGAYPIEKALTGKSFYQNGIKRDFKIKIRIEDL
mgnify:CR=1 FL=1